MDEMDDVEEIRVGVIDGKVTLIVEYSNQELYLALDPETAADISDAMRDAAADALIMVREEMH